MKKSNLLKAAKQFTKAAKHLRKSDGKTVSGNKLRAAHHAASAEGHLNKGKGYIEMADRENLS